MNLESAEAIAGAIIGGCITGIFSLVAIKMAFKYQQQHADEKEKNMIKGVLQAIHDEIEALWEIYSEDMGKHVEALGENAPLNFRYSLVSDYFTVYKGNSSLIGRIPDNDLRKQIIVTYTRAKGIVDSFRLNSILISKLEVARKMHDETGKDLHRQQVADQNEVLIKYAEILRASHQTLKTEIQTLLRSLRKHGVLAEQDN